MKTLIHKLAHPTNTFHLYTLLLIVTPFLMLQNYLQPFVKKVGGATFPIGEWNIPIALIVILLGTIALLIAFYKKINRFRVLATLVAVSFWIIGQNSSDYYMMNRFYDIQYNWHFIAYGIFSVMAYRIFKPHHVSDHRIILYTFLLATAISTFDEGIQVFISDRIFDICDIAKDMWGAIIGLIVIYFVIKEGSIVRNGWQVRQKKWIDYFRQPFSLLILEIIFTYPLLLISSLLSNLRYWHYAVLIPLGIFAIIFLILHLSQYKIWRISFIAILFLMMMVQGFFIFKYRHQNIVYQGGILTVYKGIAIPYFDVMIRSNGTFRLVDKKDTFKGMRGIVNQHQPDILILGSGNNGKAFSKLKSDLETKTPFLFNPEAKRGFLVVILNNSAACREFNRLQQEGYNTLFVLHNN